MSQQYIFVYMLCSSSRRALYTGVTNSAMIRTLQHQASDESTFAGLYKTHRLIYCERFLDVRDAIRREKRIKGWTRKKKNDLVESLNPDWKDLRLEEGWGVAFIPLRSSQPTED